MSSLQSMSIIFNIALGAILILGLIEVGGGIFFIMQYKRTRRKGFILAAFALVLMLFIHGRKPPVPTVQTLFSIFLTLASVILIIIAVILLGKSNK